MQPTNNAANGPFSAQPFGPWRVGCFSALLAPHVSILDMLVARALKNSQLASGDITTIWETVHLPGSSYASR
jgi:hypothetical protein